MTPDSEPMGNRHSQHSPEETDEEWLDKRSQGNSRSRSGYVRSRQSYGRECWYNRNDRGAARPSDGSSLMAGNSDCG